MVEGRLMIQDVLKNTGQIYIKKNPKTEFRDEIHRYKLTYLAKDSVIL